MKCVSQLAGLAVAALMLGGCDRLYWTQYQITPTETWPPATGQADRVEEGDRRAIREILARTAGDLGYVDAGEFETAETFASYRQDTEYFPMRLSAWTAGRIAVVDVFLFTPGFFWPRAKEYAGVRDRVEADLRATFGSRVGRVRFGWWGERKKLLHPGHAQDARAAH